MTISQRLARIRQLDKDLIPEAIEDANRLYAIATTTTTSFENDGSGHSSSSNAKETAMVNYAQANEYINQLVDELVDLKLDMIKFVNSIKNDKQRRFAKLYYIDHLSQRQISQKSNYQYGYVRNTLCDVKKIFK